MKKYTILAILMATSMVFGCITINKKGNDIINKPDTIVENHFIMYTNSVNISNSNIGAMLKYFLTGLKENNPKTWVDVENRKQVCVSQTTNLYIDINYPEIATQEEAFLFNSFINKNIVFEKNRAPTPSNFRHNLENTSIKFIRKMNNYEYSRRTNVE